MKRGSSKNDKFKEIPKEILKEPLGYRNYSDKKWDHLFGDYKLKIGEKIPEDDEEN